MARSTRVEGARKEVDLSKLWIVLPEVMRTTNKKAGHCPGLLDFVVN
jgi:hypothetical protein